MISTSPPPPYYKYMPIRCSSASLYVFSMFSMMQQYLNEAAWNWRLMKTILTMCHVYNKEQNYIAFDEIAPEESQPIKFLKKVMPDYA